MSSLHAALIRLYMAGATRFAAQPLRKLRQLHNWQHLDHEQTQALWRERLTSILQYAHGHVPYYRDPLRSAGVVDDAGAVDLRAWAEVPLLDKKAIQDNKDRLQSEEASRLGSYWDTTGGSTGEPLNFLRDLEYRGWMLAGQILFDEWAGCRLGDRKVILWGAMQDLLKGTPLKRRASRWVKNELFLNSLRMGPEVMREYVALINRLRPALLLGYAESLYDLATYAKEEGLPVIPPGAVMSSAGMLSDPMRQRVQEVFRCPLFDRYGAREVGTIACECREHRGLHVYLPMSYVEILGRSGEILGPGEEGEVVITLLTSQSMPFIRYRIGDMARWASDPCSCGCAWPMLEAVTGRVTDSFVKRNGERISGIYFQQQFYYEDWVRQMQIVQEDYDHIRFRLVLSAPTENPEAAYGKQIQQLRERVQLTMGPECRVSVDFVDEIETTPSGKRRHLISKVPRT